MTRRSAFTLIELLIVLAVVSIMAVLAVSTMSSAMPRARLLSDDSEVQQILLKARTRAAQTRRTEKLCLFADADPSDAISAGRVLWLEWDDVDSSRTPSVPASTPVCANEYAYTSAGYTATAVALPPACTNADGKWCLVEDVDYAATTHPAATLGHPTDHVSIYRFKDRVGPTGTWQSGLKALELSYGPSGTVTSYSSLTQGAIQLSSSDECHVTGHCTAADGSGFKNVFDVSFVFGGTVRAAEGL